MRGTIRISGLFILVAVVTTAASSPACASLRIQLDGSTIVSDADVVATFNSVDMSAGSGSSSRTQDDEKDSEVVFEQTSKTPGLEHYQSTSSAAPTSAPSDGGFEAPVLVHQAALLPSSMKSGPVVAYKSLVPSDPPPSGLLKPPRDQV